MKWSYVVVIVFSFHCSNGQILNPPVAQFPLASNVIPLPTNLSTSVALPPVLPVASTSPAIVVPPIQSPGLQQTVEKNVAPVVPSLLSPAQTKPIVETAAIVPQPVQANVAPVATAPQPSCVCGVFLSGQFVKGSNQQPVGNPALLHEQGDHFGCNVLGNKQCTNKCLDMLVKHLPNSPTIICGSMERDCYKERAYLWIQNCNSPWTNTNLSAGREYCCKDGVPYKCPLIG